MVMAAIAVVLLVLSAPVLIDVYGEAGRVRTLSPGWLIAVGLAEVSQLVAIWYILRVLLRERRWFAVAAPQLAGDAASNLVPGASLAGVGLQVSMLIRAGLPATRVMTSLAAVSLLTTVAALVVLPLVVVAMMAAGSTTEPELAGRMWLGAGVLACVLVALVVLARRDRPWLLLASLLATVGRLLRRRPDAQQLGERLLRERDDMGVVMRDRAGVLIGAALCRTTADFLALYLAMRAVGADVSVVTAMVIYIVGDIAGRIPLTPAGLGFVEVGLSGAMSIAGVPTESALLALLTYRLAATWVPSAAGLVALALFERRHAQSPPRRADPASAES